MKIIKRSGLLIPKEYQYKEFYIKIREFLERRSQEYNRSTFITTKFYIESEKFLLIPRNFPIRQYLFDYEIDDYTHNGEDIKIDHIIRPRSEAQEKAINYILENENGVLQLSPGVGKTVITIYMIATRKKKSLILVHRDPLAKQWRDRFMNFTNISYDNIARLTSATFQKDLKNPIIIATTQTFMSLLKRKREEFLKALDEANIGIFVADEVHTSVGAPTFSECSIHVPSRYTYGLSATPYRYDGNGDIIEFHLGDIYADEDVEGTMDARVNVILCDYKIDSEGRSRYIRWGGQFQRSRYLNMMKKSKPFLKLTHGVMNKLKMERNVILIAERINLIDQLYEKLDYPSKSRFYRSEGLKTLNERFTFATPGKCRDGIDAPWKDAIIMTSPISNIDQLSGRVTRSHPGKSTPIIIDMLDYGCTEIARTFYKRNQFYESKGWPVQYLIFKNNKLSKIDKDITMQILEGRQ
jgi:superfamily II DNA or RNA helicase